MDNIGFILSGASSVTAKDINSALKESLIPYGCCSKESLTPRITDVLKAMLKATRSFTRHNASLWALPLEEHITSSNTVDSLSFPQYLPLLAFPDKLIREDCIETLMFINDSLEQNLHLWESLQILRKTILDHLDLCIKAIGMQARLDVKFGKPIVNSRIYSIDDIMVSAINSLRLLCCFSKRSEYTIYTSRERLRIDVVIRLGQFVTLIGSVHPPINMKMHHIALLNIICDHFDCTWISLITNWLDRFITLVVEDEEVDSVLAKVFLNCDIPSSTLNDAYERLEASTSSEERRLLRIYGVVVKKLDELSIGPEQVQDERISSPVLCFSLNSGLRVATKITSPHNNLSQSLLPNTQVVLSNLFDSKIGSLLELTAHLAENYQNLSQDERMRCVQALGRFACTQSGTLRGDGLCDLCDTHCKTVSSGRAIIPAPYLRLFEDIIGTEGFSSNAQLRVELMRSLYRAFCSYSPNCHLTTETNIGAWIISSLNSSIRDLRLAATRLLPLFSCNAYSTDCDLHPFLKVFQNIDSGYAESTLIAWGSLAVVQEGVNLNLVLMKLLNALNMPSQLLSSLAVNQFVYLRKTKECTMWQLFAEFWPSVSLYVVKEPPALLAKFCSLAKVAKEVMLSRTRNYTLPFLVLQRRFDLIEEIANACGVKITKLIVDSVPSILATALMKKSEDEVKILLDEVDSSFRKVDIQTWYKVEYLTITFELLKMASFSQISKDSQLNQGILKIIQRIAFSKYRRSKNPVHSYFSEHILGVVALISDTIRNTRSQTSLQEKVACLEAIRFLATISGESLNQSSLQILAVLQFALQNNRLHTATFKSWSTVVEHFSTETFESVFPVGMSVVSMMWKTLDQPSQLAAKALLDVTLNRATTIELNERPVYFNYELADYNAKMAEILPSNGMWYSRLRSENFFVVRQAVLELKELLLQNRLNSRLKDGNIAVVLLDQSRNFCSSDVPILCAECLGILGFSEGIKMRSNSRAQDYIIVQNFEEISECTMFVKILLDQFLVSSFIASNDPTTQEFLAFGMQELLKLCGAKEDSSFLQYFNSFKASLLRPLMTAKYQLTRVENVKASFPIFRAGKPHKQWLLEISLTLLCGASGKNAQILITLGKILRSETETSLLNFILPYAALYAILNDPTKQMEISNELHSIFSNIRSNSLDSTLFLQSAFRVVDYFQQWIRYRTKANAAIREHNLRGRKQALAARTEEVADKAISIVSSLLQNLPPDLMADKSMQCASYPRAILYYEQYLRGDSGNEKEKLVLKNLESIYASISDIDALEGISTLVDSVSMNNVLLENSGKWDYSLECYETVAETLSQNWNSTADCDIERSRAELNILRCLTELGRYDDALLKLTSFERDSDVPIRLLESGSELSVLFKQKASYAVNSSWIKGDLESLKKWLPHSDGFEKYIGQAIYALRFSNISRVFDHLSEARSVIISEVRIQDTSSVEVCARTMQRLHALFDLESIAYLKMDGEKDSISVFQELDMRLSNVDVFAARRLLRSLRRTAVRVSSLVCAANDIDRVLIQEARDARREGRFPLSFASLLHVANKSTDEYFIQYSKLLWHQGERQKALLTLEKHLARKVSGNQAQNIMSDNEARAQLLWTKWLALSGQQGSNQLFSKYSAIVKKWPKEKAFYNFGKYCNEIYDSQNLLPESQQSREHLDGDTAKNLIENYALALSCDLKHMFEILPKLITVWLDLAESTQTPTTNNRSHAMSMISRKAVLKQVNKGLKINIQRIPSYAFYFALPQLLSRILVSEKDVLKTMITIICGVVRDYPHQSFWLLTALINSSEAERYKRGHEILRQLEESSSKLRKLIRPARKFANCLMSFCETQPPDKTPRMKLSELNFDRSTLPCSMCVPSLKYMTPNLPNSGVQLDSWSPFRQTVLIHSIDSEVEIMASLQKPKKVILIGDNGKSYRFLCKTNDDPRKDARLLELTGLVDRILKEDSEANRRNLSVSRYYVTPLNESNGIIEWVDGSCTIKGIIERLLRAKGLAINWAYCRKVLEDHRKLEPGEKLSRLIAKYPAVLHEWFLEMFPEPGAWFESRTHFARSTAVMSMVGYILGLGDRHGENILINEHTGGVLHVDFDCLLEKGLTFKIPERVPFRLTQNIVDALGPARYEGTFRRACEITMSLVRSHEIAMMTQLESFVYDPTLDYVMKNTKEESKAKPALKSCKNKMVGIQQDESLPLSVPGQVEMLLQQATDIYNLERMYVGWGAFL